MKDKLQERIRTLMALTLKRWDVEREIEGLLDMTIDDFAPVYDACVTVDDPCQLSKRALNEIIKTLRSNNR